MKNPIKNLAELQSLEFDETILMPLPAAQKRIAALRKTIPKPVLDHYNRLCDQGKKGVAALRHQVCTGCHMRVPLAAMVALMGGEDIHLCENCGRYLYFEAEPAVAAAPAPKKPRASNAVKHLVHAL